MAIKKEPKSAYRFESAMQEQVEHSKFSLGQELGPHDVEEAELAMEEGAHLEDDPDTFWYDPKMAAPESGTNHQDPPVSVVDRTAGPDDTGQPPPEESGEDF